MSWNKTSFLLLLLSAHSAWAINDSPHFPIKPVRWVVPYPAGGSIDVVARLVASRLSNLWGQSIVIDNRLGAGGRIGTQAVIAASADGYTQLMTLNTNYTMDKSLFKNIGYDPEKALQPICLIASTAQMLVASHNFSVKTVKDLVNLAKSQPNSIHYGSSGAGGSLHLAMELFKSMADIKMNHIPYKGGPSALTDLMSGQIKVMFFNTPAALPYIQSGKIVALGISTAKRSPRLPDVPTIAEAGQSVGLSGFDIAAWFGLSVPQGTDKKIIKDLSQQILQILARSELKDQLSLVGAEVVGLNPEQTTQRIHKETAQWAKLIEHTNIRFE